MSKTQFKPKTLLKQVYRYIFQHNALSIKLIILNESFKLRQFFFLVAYSKEFTSDQINVTFLLSTTHFKGVHVFSNILEKLEIYVTH